MRPIVQPLHPILALLAPVALLVGCAVDTGGPRRPPEYRTTLDELLLEDARRCDSGFEYPQSLVDGIGRQLVEELQCMDDTILEFYEPCQETGCIWADGPQPLAMRPEVIVGLRAAATQEDDFISITAAYRDVAMQYYSRWYKENCDASFDAAVPGESNHQGGRAVDVRYYDFWWDALLDNGFDHPIPGDRPHFELVGTAAFRAESAALQELSVLAYQRLWNRNNPDDRIPEDGVYGATTKARLGFAPVEGFPTGACPAGTGGDVGAPDVGPDADSDAGTDAESDAADTGDAPDSETDAAEDTTGADTTEPDTAADVTEDTEPDVTVQDTGAIEDTEDDATSPDVAVPDSESPGVNPLPLYTQSTGRAETRGCATAGGGGGGMLFLALCALLPRRRRSAG